MNGVTIKTNNLEISKKKKKKTLNLTGNRSFIFAFMTVTVRNFESYKPLIQGTF